jgi:hypothetical protein
VATRFYLPSTGAASVSPSYAAWTNTAQAGTRLKCVTTKISSAMADLSITDGVGAAATFLMRQWVSDPISAQTVSGTVKGQMRFMDDTLGAYFDTTDICLKVVSNDGTTLRGTLLALGSYKAANDFTQTRTNRMLADGDALSSVVAETDDRLVIEVGVTASTLTLDVIATCSNGDDSGTDFAEDETATAANNPWIEFSGTITFSQSTSPSAVSSVGAVLAGGLLAGVIANASIGVALAGSLAIGPLAVDCVVLASGPNSVAYSVLAVDSAGEAVMPESAAVVPDSYDPSANTPLPVDGLLDIDMTLRPTTPGSLGDQNRGTGEDSGYIYGTLTDDLYLYGTVVSNTAGDPGVIGFVRLFAYVSATDAVPEGKTFVPCVSPLFILKVGAGARTTYSLASGTTPQTPGIFDHPQWVSVDIATRPTGGAWTLADLDALSEMGIKATYSLSDADHYTQLTLDEVWAEIHGPQGSDVSPFALRLKAGNLRLRLDVAGDLAL